MDYFNKQISLDVNAGENYKLIHAKEGDAVLRQIVISTTENGVPYIPADLSEAMLRVEKPDGTAVVLSSIGSSAAITVSGNVFTCTLTAQCLAAPGRAKCDLDLVDSLGNISTCNFFMDVVKIPDVTDQVQSLSEWQELLDVIEEAEAFAQIVGFRSSGGYLQYTLNGSTWINICLLSDIISPITNAQIDALF